MATRWAGASAVLGTCQPGAARRIIARDGQPARRRAAAAKNGRGDVKTMTGLYRKSLLAAVAAIALTPALAGAQMTDLVVGATLEPPSLDPTTTAAAAVDEVTYHNIFEGLTMVNENGEVIPGLAESWDISDDGLTYTFHLLDGVMFADGTAFDADDVVFTFERLIGEESVSAKASLFAAIESVEALDPGTVQFNLSRQEGLLLFNLGGGDAAVVNEESIDQIATDPMGTGPYVVGDRVEGDRLTLVRNPHYRDPDGVYFDTVTFRYITDPAAQTAAVLSGESTSALDLTAATVHMLAACLLFAAVSLALSAWTGNRALASGAGVAFLAVSYLAAGLLPLFDGLEQWAKVSPWYWIDGTNPLLTGIDWTAVIVLLAAAGAVAATGWWGLSRRDLGSGATRVPILERLRADPRLGRAVSMLAGRGSTRGIATRALTDLRPVLLVAGGFAAFQALVLGVLFNAISEDIGPIVDAMPESILAMVGFADFSTPEGWYFGESLSIMGPAVVAIVAITAGAALSREERTRTASVLLALPVSRTAVAWRKALALVAGAALVGVMVALAILAGNAIAGLGMDPGHILAAGALLAALGVVLGGAAFLAGGITGRASAAVGTGTGVAVVGWGINSFVPVNPDLADWAKVSPFYYYGSSNPLEAGMTWWHLGVLVGVAAVLIVAGVAAYRARDLRG